MELILPNSLNSLLTIIGLVAFSWLAWQSTKDAIFWILLLLPSFLIRFTIFGIPATFLEVIIWITFILWLVKDKRYSKINLHLNKKSLNKVPKNFKILIALVLLFATISVFTSPNITAALGIWKAYFIEALLFFIIVIYSLDKPKDFYKILNPLGILTLVLFALALFQKFTGLTIPEVYWSQLETRRITTLLEYPNANALLVAPIVALYLGYIRKHEPLLKQLFKFSVILAGFCIVLWAESSGALLALFAALLVLMIRNKKTRSFAIALAIVAIMIPLNIPAVKFGLIDMTERIANQELNLESTSFEIRSSQWLKTWNFLTASPSHFILGAGLAGYQQEIKSYHKYDFLEIFLYPHNIFLNFWVELGLLGMLTFILIFALVIRMLFSIPKQKERQPLQAGLLLSFIVILIHGLVDVPYFKNDLSVLFWLLVALTILNNTKVPAQSKNN